jgi:hypothetical protein
MMCRAAFGSFSWILAWILLKERDLPDIKRSDFKAVVVPLIKDQFNVCLRNDLDGAGVRGWKGVAIQSLPGRN